MPHVPIDHDPRAGRPSAPAAYPGITAFVCQAASWPADHPTAVAARDAGVRTVVLQVADPATDEANLDEVRNAGWAKRWLDAGCRVEKWWRVEQHDGDVDPHSWLIWNPIPNVESPAEIARIPALLDASLPRAIITLGKVPGVPVGLLNERGVVLFAECFREGPTSDHTIAESHVFWEAEGLNMRLWRPCLQAYGQPFAPLGEQAEDARWYDPDGVGVYPAETVSAADWQAVGEGRT